MDWKGLTLADIYRLVKVIEQAGGDADTVIRDIINRAPRADIPHGRITMGALIALLDQLNGSTVLPDAALEFLHQLESPPVPEVAAPPTEPIIYSQDYPPEKLWLTAVYHFRRQPLRWDPLRAILHADPRQDRVNETITGDKLEPILDRQLSLNMCVLEYLVTHQELIPTYWRNLHLFFWGTIYQSNSDSSLWVPYLHYDRLSHKWRLNFQPRNAPLSGNDVALLYPVTEPEVAAPPPPPATFAELIAACGFTFGGIDITEANFPLTDDGTTGPPVEELKLTNVDGIHALKIIAQRGYRPVGMRRALEYIAQHRDDIKENKRDIAIVGAVHGDRSPVIFGDLFAMRCYQINGTYPGKYHYLVTRK